MTKLGVCSMIIEPHVFETTLYTVREIQSHFIPPKPLPQPPPPPPDMRYSSFSHVAIYPPATRVTSASLNHQDQQHRNSSQLTLPTFNEGFAHLGSQGPPHHNLLSAPDRTESVFGNTGISDTRQDDRNEKPNDDPVIQMLATRAASNHDLKSLMRVVASGNATQTQLKDFQNHIDELNDILKTRHKENQSPYGAEHGLRTISSTNKQAPSNQSLPSDSTFGVGYAPNVKTARVASTSAPKPLKQESSPQYFSHYMQPLKSKNTTSYKSEISSIVFDLGGGGDRFSFPRLSILEYLPGGTQVIVSFLVIRRGSTAVSKGYKETASYYEPITMRLSSHQPRVLEPLSRVVAPPDEVRQYMDSVFDKMDPAEKVFLAIRLPRTKENTSTEKEDTSVQPQPAEIKLTYSPPNALVPIAA